MARVGRKPLTTGHVDRLDGSERAKQRMTVILETLRGQMTIPEACQKLGVNEARFHALRQQWLQEALALLEPRRRDRPPKPVADPKFLELEQAHAEVERQLQQVQVQLDVQRGLATLDAMPDAPAKKTRAKPRRRQRAAARGQAKSC